VRSHGPVSFPCNLHPLPASHFPVSKLLCTSPLCLPHLLFLSCPRVLDYSVRNQPIRPFLPCPVPRVPAFPSVGPEYSIRAPLPSPWPPANQHTACKYRISTSSVRQLKEAPSSTSSRDWIETFCCAGRFLSFPVDWPILPPVCCPSDTRANALAELVRVPFLDSSLTDLCPQPRQTVDIAL
jgi:hypothetical protein